MKLIDILVEELPKRGGWPRGAAFVAQEEGGGLYSFTSKPQKDCDDEWMDESSCGYHKKVGELPEASDHDTSTITREQYEDALAAKNDGWIEWAGGECQVDAREMVDVIFGHGGRMSANIADCWLWTHKGTDSDIIAYLLHKPQVAEQANTDDEADLNECIGQDAAPAWNGEGLPPVGMEIEYSFAKVNYRTDFSRGKVLAYGMQSVFMEHWASKNEFIQPLDKIEFRPIRSEADRKRDAAVEAIDYWMPEFIPDTPNKYYHAKKIYDAIAAGKIPGVKLED